MDTQRILTSNYLDLIYDGRNKKYGSYELRINYAKRMRNALVLLLGLSAGMCSYAVFAVNRPVKSLLIKEREITLTRLPVDIPKPPVPPPPPTHQVPPPAVRPTVAFNVPVIVDNEDLKENEKPAEQVELRDKTPGSLTLDGDSAGIDAVIATSGKGKGFIEPPFTPVIERYVHQMPEPLYNVNQYLSKNINYPMAARDNNIEGRVIIQFVVNEDGSITNAEVVGNRRVGGGLEEEALRVVGSMPRWKPGKQNGREVKVYYTLPVSFKLE